MKEDSTSSVKEVISLHLGASSLAPIVEKITPIASYSERTNKRDFSDAMDTKKEDIARTPKKQKVEKTIHLVKVSKDKGNTKNQMKVKGPAFEVKEYDFAETPTDSTS